LKIPFFGDILPKGVTNRQTMPRLQTLSTLVSLTASFYLFQPLQATAQMIPDNSLGNENSVVVPNQNIRGIESDRIDGGAIRGSNLFHSFQEFNIDNGRGAYFSNPEAISNILTRVTGSNLSNILGTLGVLGNANLFLINPNGIVFGPNARLDVGGSFFASTADGILFENGVEFAASNPDAPPLLTINIPIGLNFRENPGSLVNQARSTELNSDGTTNLLGLAVSSQETIALIGGEVRFEGGVIVSPGSHLELGGLSEPGIVELNPDGSLIFPTNTQRADVLLTDGAFAGVAGNPGGSVVISARNLEISGDSLVANGVNNISNPFDSEVEENIETGILQAGDITINATESVILTGQDSIVANQVLPNVTGNAGNIDIQTNLLSVGNGALISNSTFGNGNGGNLSINTQQLQIQDGASITTGTFGNGNGGNLTVNATDVELVGRGSSLDASVQREAIGNGGNLTINTQRLRLQDRAQIRTGTLGNGDGGDLTVNATDIELVGAGTLLSASVQPGATGNGGNLFVNTQRLRLQDRADIVTGTFGNGNGGNLTVNATDIELAGTGTLLAASVQPEATGNGGNLTISTQRLRLQDAADISVSTAGNGDGGNLIINATDIELAGADSSLRASVNLGGMGNGGTVIIDTQNLLVRDGAQINVATAGNGNGGDLTINATNIELVGGSADGQFPSALGVSVAPGATGNGGTVIIDTQNLRVRDGADISASTSGNGDGGNLTITATNIEMVGTSANAPEGRAASSLGVAVQPEGIGNSGTLTIDTQRLLVRDGAQIGASTFGNGDGGNLIINATDIELVGSGSSLTASVEPGGRGNGSILTIDTQNLLVRDGAQINSVTFGNGDGGNLTVTANNIELSGITPDGSAASGLFTSATSQSTGQAGRLTVNAENLTVQDRATIDVRSESTEAAGNLIINAPNIFLDNQASLNGETTAGEGDIILNTDDLRLRNNSNITTNATGEATGGNIEINTETLTALENSDISANAEDAFGGRVTINATGIFGTAFRTQQSQFSDITATSELGPEFSGTVELNTELDPSSGLIDLTQTVVDPSDLIAQEFCRQRGESEFVVTGKGGIAADPNDKATGDQINVDLVEPVPSQPRNPSQRPSEAEDNQTISSLDIVPARGWIRDENGDVILVSYDPTKTGIQRQPSNIHPCQNN
jgi:filamentous hemagglutinin family protein